MISIPFIANIRPWDQESTPAATEEEESPVKKDKKKVVLEEEPGADPEDIDLESFGKKKKKKKVREGLDSLEDVKEALPEDSEVSKFIMRKNITKIPRLPPRLMRN